MAQLLRRQEQLHDGGVVVVVDVVVLRVRLWPFGTGVTVGARLTPQAPVIVVGIIAAFTATITGRSEEHTSELQSRGHLVCRLLLEKKIRKNCFEFCYDIETIRPRLM